MFLEMNASAWRCFNERFPGKAAAAARLRTSGNTHVRLTWTIERLALFLLFGGFRSCFRCTSSIEDLQQRVLTGSYIVQRRSAGLFGVAVSMRCSWADSLRLGDRDDSRRLRTRNREITDSMIQFVRPRLYVSLFLRSSTLRD